MRVPTSAHQFADYSGGSIRITDGAGGCEHLTLAQAYARHSEHFAEMKLAAKAKDMPAHDFHQCWERSLRNAIAESSRIRLRGLAA